MHGSVRRLVALELRSRVTGGVFVARILVVDDDANSVAFLRILLRDAGHIVHAVVSSREALSSSSEFTPDVLLTDWLLKDGSDGLNVARSLRAANPALRVVLMSGMPSHELDRQLADMPAAVAIEKPLDLELLLKLVDAPWPATASA